MSYNITNIDCDDKLGKYSVVFSRSVSCRIRVIHQLISVNVVVYRRGLIVLG